MMIQMLHNETPTDRLVRDSIVCSYLWNGITKDTLILMDYLCSTHLSDRLLDQEAIKLNLELLNTGKTKLKD
ncbi:MAG: hypothetical protein CMJ17_00360 [Phenylobacterium sp.]|nr:hypothetical protein [Phenylobacterium sp.]